MKPGLQLGPETMGLPFSVGLTTRSSGFAPCAANNLIFSGGGIRGKIRLTTTLGELT